MRLFKLILALVCMTLVACGKSVPTSAEAHADLAAKVNKAIKDPARAQRVSERAGELLDQQQATATDLKSTIDRLAALNADYNATNDQYTALYNEYQSKRKAAQLNFKDGIFALRKDVSAEEWKEITK
jgi:predicted component of type VI protein secretion system